MPYQFFIEIFICELYSSYINEVFLRPLQKLKIKKHLIWSAYMAKIKSQAQLSNCTANFSCYLSKTLTTDNLVAIISIRLLLCQNGNQLKKDKPSNLIAVITIKTLSLCKHIKKDRVTTNCAIVWEHIGYTNKSIFKKIKLFIFTKTKINSTNIKN